MKFEVKKQSITGQRSSFQTHIQIWASEDTKNLNPKNLQMGSQAGSGVQCENQGFSQAGHKQSARSSHWTEQQGANSSGSRRLQKGAVREGLKLSKIWKKDKIFEGTSGPRESIRVSSRLRD
jgi:hypothetical protein